MKKTDAGYINVSSPKLTVLDLIYYHKRICGINRTLSIIEEINLQKLYETTQRYTNNTTIQRLDFLFDEILNETALANSLYKSIENKTTNKALLSSLSKDKGKINKK